MKYAMVSMLIPKEYEETFLRDGKKTMQDAASVLQWHIYNGLCENLGTKIPLFNILPCGSFPQYSKKVFVPKFSFDQEGKNLGFCNIKLIRNVFRTETLKSMLYNWCCSDQEPKTLFVYTLSHPILSAVAAIKRHFPEVRVCAIVADLPDMSNLSSDKSLIHRIFATYRAKKSYARLSAVDYFALLTKHMAEYMSLYQPYCVMEGIATAQDEFSEPAYDSEIKTVFYGGTLHRRFGVLHLLEAFQQITEQNYRLILCGTGDCEEEIKMAAEKDCRIQFYGQKPRAEVLKLQAQSTVLVNPRQNNEVFTKYSFPSKNLEYLSSGIPVVAYKLDGIPDEYDEYILYVEGNDAESLTRKIIETCEKTSQERKAIGMKARDFVTKQKNQTIQTGKILALLNGGE